jgi:hypothetical protein
LGFLNNNLFKGRQTSNLEDQFSVFMTPRDMVAQLYPQAQGTHYSRLLRYAWVTVGLFFNPCHHKVKALHYSQYIFYSVYTNILLISDLSLL